MCIARTADPILHAEIDAVFPPHAFESGLDPVDSFVAVLESDRLECWDAFALFGIGPEVVREEIVADLIVAAVRVGALVEVDGFGEGFVADVAPGADEVEVECYLEDGHGGRGSIEGVGGILRLRARRKGTYAWL